MSLPPANSDPRILQIRSITQLIYPPLFSSFQIISKLTSTYNQIAASSEDKILKDDIAWLKESIDKDIEKLTPLQSHLQFLNAQETITTPAELLKVFNEITDFTQLILLDDLITTLKGIESVNDSLVVRGIPLKDVILRLQKFSISLKLSTEPVKKLQGDEVTGEGLQKVDKIVGDRIHDLKKRLTDLQQVTD